MTGIQLLRLVALSLLTGCCVWGADVPLSLNIVESTRTATVSYSTGNTASQDIHQSGMMYALLTFDLTTQRPTAIRFTDGVMHESPASFTNTANINFYGHGTKRVTHTQSSSGLQLTVYTIGSAQPIDSDGRVGDMDRLQSFPTAGILTAELTIDGRTQTQSIDVATNPPDNVEPSTGTEMRVQVIKLLDRATTSHYKATFNVSVNESRSRRMPNTDTTVTSSTVGTSIAEAEFTAPNKFGQWLLDSGYSLNDEHATNERGVHLAALFAFNMTANDTLGFPWGISNGSIRPVITLRLPENGLQKAVRVDVCDDLKTGDWETVSAADFLDGNSNLGEGASGIRRISVSGSANRFCRIVHADLVD